jgi:hypothetical protein
MGQIRVTLQTKSNKTKKGRSNTRGHGKVNYWELDTGHASNQIGKHKEPTTDTRLHAKLGQPLRTTVDQGHGSNQIGKHK